ncbi:hypothetical protein BV22DRAFT_1034653 [Leucogyrophana mollusca]|uniref:Uncharacterized protein n=1 Tax=Leucogyrophana mollusca TaxID=85980 RepID=A0ACB8BGI0_9AGAM|nr:hypothetical protein BV22DRAFT_1034653 [Leucogyrophana mollusca]
MTSTTEPPYYILVAHSSLQNSTSGSSSNALAHPDIEYRYADDSALSLLPRYPDEHVLVLNHDPIHGNAPTVKSTSGHLAVTGIKVSNAPGAGADEEEPSKNDNMYVLEVTSASDDQNSIESSQAYLQNPQATLARFKQRNAVLRRVLDYPAPLADVPRISRPNSQPTFPSHPS